MLWTKSSTRMALCVKASSTMSSAKTMYGSLLKQPVLLTQMQSSTSMTISELYPLALFILHIFWSCKAWIPPPTLSWMVWSAMSRNGLLPVSQSTELVRHLPLYFTVYDHSLTHFKALRLTWAPVPVQQFLDKYPLLPVNQILANSLLQLWTLLPVQERRRLLSLSLILLAPTLPIMSMWASIIQWIVQLTSHLTNISIGCQSLSEPTKVCRNHRLGSRWPGKCPSLSW